MKPIRRILFALALVAVTTTLHAKVGEKPASALSVNNSLVAKLQFPTAEMQRTSGGLAVVQFTVDNAGTVQVLGVAANDVRLAQFVEQRLQGTTLGSDLQPGVTYLVKLYFKAV